MLSLSSEVLHEIHNINIPSKIKFLELPSSRAQNEIQNMSLISNMLHTSTHTLFSQSSLTITPCRTSTPGKCLLPTHPAPSPKPPLPPWSPSDFWSVIYLHVVEARNFKGMKRLTSPLPQEDFFFFFFLTGLIFS